MRAGSFSGTIAFFDVTCTLIDRISVCEKSPFLPTTPPRLIPRPDHVQFDCTGICVAKRQCSLPYYPDIVVNYIPYASNNRACRHIDVGYRPT